MSKRSKGKFLLRLLMVFAVAIGVSLGALYMLGGDKAMLRTGLEGNLSQATGYDVRIGTLNNASFFPFLEIDIADVRFHQTIPGMVIDAGRVRAPGRVEAVTEKPMPGPVVATVDAAKLKVSFGDLILSRTRFRVLDMTGIKIDREATGYRAIALDHVGIDAAASALVVSGTYGDDAVSIRLDMVNDGGDSNPIWRVKDNAILNASVGAVSLQTGFDTGLLGGAVLNITQFGLADHPVVGAVKIGRHNGGLRIAGEPELTLGDFKFVPDVIVGATAENAEKIHGTIRVDGVPVAGSSDAKALADLYSALAALATPIPDTKAAKNAAPFWNDALDHIQVMQMGDGSSLRTSAFLNILQDSPTDTAP
ncbi:hypothetical protein [Micavibrio aeruginosavorus]|uniref:hypothetical protein n=1 Tax=Micavibrio aeruginosavorus TaxID=349221 RepID=UPI003F4ADE8C